MVLEGLTPEKVFFYFEELSAIPHGSGNTQKTTAYLIDFAKKHKLEHYTDDIGNILIRKDGTDGRENEEYLILQGHTDMVCVKNEDKEIDFENETITIKTDGKKVWADGTSLGADNGIAVAYMLAVLDSDNISHPPLEALFTVDEEIGMLGAAAFDTTLLKGRRLINIDSEDEGVFTVSCAGGIRSDCIVPVDTVSASGKCLRLSVSGLLGGHSGVEIDKGRTNAAKLMGRILNHLSKKIALNIVLVSGGTKDNAIPSSAQAVICVKEEAEKALINEFNGYFEVLKKELSETEKGLSSSINEEITPDKMYSENSTRTIIFALYHCPDGIITMSSEIKGMVQTSLNLGILDCNTEKAKLSFALRSSVSSEKQELSERLASFMEFIGGKAVFSADYPAWEYRKASPLRNAAIKAFNSIYGKEPKIEAIHAGLECGIFAGKMSDIDCISLGPDLEDVHSADECMYVDSAERTWELLLEILKATPHN